MKILIADDEQLARQRLRILLTELSSDYVTVGEAANGLEVVRQCKTLHPDLVLLDIRMPGMDGIYAARQIALLIPSPAVIFTTAYNEHALQAFDVNAIDYLVKPIRIERLETALNKAKSFIGSRSDNRAGMQTQDLAVRTRISVRVRGELKLIAIDEICFFRAEQKYTVVKTGNNETLIEEPLTALEKEFEERFIRIHRNALVAINYIEGLEKERAGRTVIKIHGIDSRLEVSRRHIPKVRALLKKFVHL